jgi:LEA14-like dessication related protein
MNETKGVAAVLRLLALALLLGGCAAVKPKAPDVALQSVRLVEVGLSEQRFTLTLLVRNPNPGDYVLTGLTYEAELGGKPFAKGVSRQRAVIVGYGESRIEVPAAARLAHLMQGLLGGLDALLGEKEGGELEYRVHGTVEVEGMGSLPFDRRGKFRPGPASKPAASAGQGA